MANICIVLGASGTGKSTSIKTLNPKDTFVINVLRKRLPFKGSKNIYSKENKNYFEPRDYKELFFYLNNINEKGTNIKNIIIDDAIYLMRKEYFDKCQVLGYNKYTELAVNFQSLIERCEGMRNDLNIFFFLHQEIIYDGQNIIGYKVSTVGKMLDNQYNPIEVVPMVLFAMPQIDKDVVKYGFYTHLKSVNGVTICAKSPDGMFEDDFIPNDLKYVVDKMNEYYN